jgi:uncharacterized protein (DUF1501 family)
MQTSVPALTDIATEPKSVRDAYGVERMDGSFAANCLLARRLAERGVRFIQLYHRDWDHHSRIKGDIVMKCREVDQASAALVSDLKQRGMLDDTLVVWATEFGRTPGVEGNKGGRDHHTYGFTIWMAGAGVKGGIAHGATDELGFHAVENRHYVTDVHATILHQLGLDPRRLDVPGHKRIEIDYGQPVKEILA